MAVGLQDEGRGITHLASDSKYSLGPVRGFSQRIECVLCGDIEESIAHAFFLWPVGQMLCQLLEGFVVRVLHVKFFIGEISSVRCNVLRSLNKNVFLSSLSIMIVMIWTIPLKGFHKGESFSSQTLVAISMDQIKIKILSERQTFSFGVR